MASQLLRSSNDYRIATCAGLGQLKHAQGTAYHLSRHYSIRERLLDKSTAIIIEPRYKQTPRHISLPYEHHNHNRSNARILRARTAGQLVFRNLIIINMFTSDAIYIILGQCLHLARNMCIIIVDWLRYY